ncbi:MAG TPA: gluconolactonase [Gammaproteobacteria bacterium]|nr:gluconolactonase [Gammaproteobacteria bacterium]|tara:strand:- start:3745 stop:4596 length:852 start_codon:yes stop_codon:yes gene_type:complete
MSNLFLNVLADNFVFLEGPRWHNGELWFSDMWGHKVHRITPAGVVSDVIDVPGRPSGLGFMPDGTLLIASMADRCVYKNNQGNLEVHADLSATVNADINDIIIDKQGRTYVGNFGYDLLSGADPKEAELVLIEPTGEHRVVTSGLMFPNGMVLMDDERTLIVAETFSNQLTAFDCDTNGDLRNRRVFADMGELTPDGICLDIEGGIWVASFMTGDFVRVVDGGDITDRIKVDSKAAVACQIGGPDNRTLYCLTFAGEMADLSAGKRLARIETVTVDIQGAGSP